MRCMRLHLNKWQLAIAGFVDFFHFLFYKLLYTDSGRKGTHGTPIDNSAPYNDSTH